jgi:hypothetical protein
MVNDVGGALTRIGEAFLLSAIALALVGLLRSKQ